MEIALMSCKYRFANTRLSRFVVVPAPVHTSMFPFSRRVECVLVIYLL